MQDLNPTSLAIQLLGCKKIKDHKLVKGEADRPNLYTLDRLVVLINFAFEGG